MDKLSINCMTGEVVREIFNYTPEETAAKLVQDEQDRVDSIKLESTRRKIALIPDWDEEHYAIQRDQALMRAAVLSRREAKGLATPDEVTELDNLETLSINLDAINAVELQSITDGTALIDIIWP